MRTTTPWRARAAAIVATVLAGALAACTDDAPSEPDGSPSASATASEPAPTDEPSEEPSTEVPTGEKRTVGSLTLTFPDGWKVERVTEDVVDATGPDPATDYISVVSSIAFSERPLDEIAESTKNDVSWKGEPTREPNVEAGGVEMLHWSGQNVLGARGDIHVGLSGGHQVEVIVQTSLPRAEHEALRESLLAGFSWQ
jgi:hypothetical protein